MLHRLKDAFYFPVAQYFAFFARIRLQRWKPRVIVVTGSNGKTTALHMLEARLGNVARYSHHRNSSFGIPFDILGLGDASESRWRWPLLALQAPFRAWERPYPQSIYVVEADCDRPGEGAFLSDLLQPEAVVWLNCARTHSMRFEHAIQKGSNIDEAIAHEYGFFLERAGALCVVNGDDARIMAQTKRSHANISTIKEVELTDYHVSIAGTTFRMHGGEYSFPYLLPRDVFRATAAAEMLAQHLGITGNDSFAAFTLPPGRSSMLKGVKNTALIDSSYNINTNSLSAILAMTKELSGTKWLVLGDMTEQGDYEREEHEKVAQMVALEKFARVVLVGPRSDRYVLPVLQAANVPATAFTGPKEALEYLVQNVRGGEILVFKGARFLEGIIEHMLADPNDADKLCRREPHWQKRRREWGL